MNEYYNKLEQFIASEELWPTFRNPTFIAELHRVSSEVFSTKTLEGFLSSILIDQQIAEEMVLVLLEDSKAMIKISLMQNAEIEFSKGRKRMFGQSIQDLRDTLEFNGKDKIISKCESLNTIRISVVHGLSANTKISDIEEIAKEAKQHFIDLKTLFEDAHRSFCDFFEREKENLRNDYIEQNMEIWGQSSNY